MRTRLAFGLLLLCSLAAFGPLRFGGGSVAAVPTIAFSTLANAPVSSTTPGSGSYTVAAPSGLTATWGGGCSGSSTVTGFSASAGAWSATFSTPSSAGIGCTLAVTGTGSNTASATSPGVQITSSGDYVFTATATYFMSPSGSDFNSGTSAGSPWATPNHALNCGDVIIAASGTYNGDFATWGTVSNCPSTTGGIDGTGGVYFATLLCGGNLQTCNINCATAACNAGHLGSGGRNAVSAGMNINASNWSIEGFAVNGNGNAHRGFQVDACLTTSTILHHIAFINDATYNNASGFSVDECGYGTAVPGNGNDEWAVVGSIVQEANLDAICVGAVDNAGFANHDSNSGTHIFVAGNFVYANSPGAASISCTSSDVEGIIMDSADVHGYTGNMDIENNIVYDSNWVGLQVFQQTYNSSSLTINTHHNTFYGNDVCPVDDLSASGEINLQINGNFPWTINTYDNIARTSINAMHYGFPACSTATGFHAYAMLISGGSNVTVTTGGSGLQNIFYGIATACDNGSSCGGSGSSGSGLYSTVYYSPTTAGTNTYEDPAFTNTSDLLTNWVGAPSCASYTNAAACMGWNYSTQTATADTPIADLVPTGAGTSGKGYQPPAACASNSLYPTWLKGIVFLQWNGSTLTEKAGLINKPCNL